MNSSVTVKSELIWDGPAEFSALLLPPEDLRDLLIDTPKQGLIAPFSGKAPGKQIKTGGSKA